MDWSKKLILTQYTKVWARPFFVTAFFIMLFMTQTSCQQETRNSVLILAFDQLDNERLNCSDERIDENSGFVIICKEFMRFTHAYTTSLQPAAAIGSILTGQYPLSHSLHRSFDVVDEKIKTVQEVAYRKNYRTGFFAGNPHILKKTGLARYFETFDDSAAAQYSSQIVKDFKLTAQSFLDWQKEESGRPFFAVITNSEIDAANEQDTATTNLEKLDEKIYNFINELKQLGIWERTFVYVVGLRGSNNYNRLNETPFLNLHSENTQVSLMIKPPRMQGDEGISWKNDIPITLADLGYSLKKFFGVDDPSNLADFPLLDLSQFYSQNQTTVNRERNIIVEAANPWVKEPLQLNFATITPTLLVIDRKDETEIYNLATDRFEVVNLFNNKSTEQDLPPIRRLFMNTISLPDQMQNITLARDFLKNSLPQRDFFSVQVPENHPLFLFWLAQEIRTGQPEKLQIELLDRPFAGCLKLLQKAPTSLSQLKPCNDNLFSDYLKMKYAQVFDLNPDKAKLTYELSRKRYFEEIRISVWNLALENIWGLYNEKKIWYHPLVFIEQNFAAN